MSETAITRTMEEITASARINMADMINRAIALGQDLIDAKEQLGHGKFGPWLKELGISTSTAGNYMKVAREIAPGSRLAGLPYSKALALLSAPADEREELAGEAESKSAAEIRRLIEERNRAIEAANAETARADQAEQDAKMFNQENAHLRTEIRTLEALMDRVEPETQELLRKCDEEARAEEREKINDEMEKMRQQLECEHARALTAENNVVEVDVVPADYEELKKTRAELLAAAADAEQRAADAEAELEALRANGSGAAEPAWKILKKALDRFMTDCELLPMDPASLIGCESRIDTSIGWLESWCGAMREAMTCAVAAEGAVQ